MSMTETGLTNAGSVVICRRMGVTVTQAEKDAFAAKLQAWRKREGFSQRDGAIALGVPKRTLQGWELATRKPIALTERMILAVIEPKKRKAKK